MQNRVYPEVPDFWAADAGKDLDPNTGVIDKRVADLERPSETIALAELGAGEG